MSATDTRKMIRETLCLAESALVERARCGIDADTIYSQHLPRIGRMIAILDRREVVTPGTADERDVAHEANVM